MTRLNSIKTATLILALGLSNAAWALWSPKPMDHMDTGVLSGAVVEPPVADAPKVPMGYTPPVDIRTMDLVAHEGSDDPVIRHLAAGQATEVIETPAFSSGGIGAAKTFTRVNPAKVLDDRKSAATGQSTDIPIPGPATYWLILFALVALFGFSRSRE